MEDSQGAANLVPLSGKAEESRKSEIARAAMPTSIKHSASATDIPVNLGNATKLSLADIASLGTAFGSLPSVFRTVTQTVNIPGESLLRATDKFGNPLDINILQAFNDGSGLMGSFRDSAKGFEQARLHPVASQTADVVTTMPYDPTSLFMAAALMEINKKLDAIEETQQEMFDYIRDKDKAELRGNLETLSDVLNNYQFNWDNTQYKNNKHILVQQIRNDAEKAIIQHRAQIERKLDGEGVVHVDKNVRDKADVVRDELGEYRLAIYLYSFASFLEVMLLENFEADYLRSTAEKIDGHSLRYRELYTKAYDVLEAAADSSVRAVALGGIAGAMGFLGKAIEKTPIGDHTPIDEALQGAGKSIGEFSEGVKGDMMGKITDARSSDVRPFIDNIESVNRLYNEPVMLLADEDAIYVLPIEASDTEGDEDETDGQNF